MTRGCEAVGDQKALCCENSNASQEPTFGEDFCKVVEEVGDTIELRDKSISWHFIYYDETQVTGDKEGWPCKKYSQEPTWCFEDGYDTEDFQKAECCACKNPENVQAQ